MEMPNKVDKVMNDNETDNNDINNQINFSNLTIN